MPLLYHPSSFCDICYDTYSDTVEPYVIGCGHVFCKTCLESIPSAAPARGTVISNPVCPTCRKTYWSNKIRRLYVDLYTGENQPEEHLAREQALDELELLDKLLHHWDEDEDELPPDIVAEIEAWLQVRSGENTPVVQRLTSLLRKYKKVRKRSKQDRHEARRLRDRLERHDVRHQQEAEMATGVERSLQEQIIELRCKVTEYETQVYSLQIALAERQQGPPPPPPVPARPNEPALTRSNTEPALPQSGLTRTLSNPASVRSVPSTSSRTAPSIPVHAPAPSSGYPPPQPPSEYPPSEPSRYATSIHSTHNPLPPPPEPIPLDQYRGFTPAALQAFPAGGHGYPTSQTPGPGARQTPGSTRAGQTPGGYPASQTPAGYPASQTPGYPATQPSGGYPPSSPGHYPSSPPVSFPPSPPAPYPPTQPSAVYPVSMTPGPSRQTPGSIRSGQTPGSVHTGQTSGSAYSGQIPGSIRSGQTPGSTRSGQTPGSVRSGQTARSSTPPDGIIPGASPTSRVHPSKGLGGAARSLAQDASPPRSHGESSNRAHAEASTRAPIEGSHRAPAEGSHRAPAEGSHRAPESSHRAAESSNRPPGTSHLVPESSHRSRRHRTTRSETAAAIPQQQPAATMPHQQAAATIPHQPTPSYAWDPAALNDAAAALASSATTAGHVPTGSTAATGHVPNAPTQAGPNYAPPPTTHPTAPSGPRIYPPPMSVSTSQRQFDSNGFLLPAAMQGGPNGQSFTNGHARTESYPDGYMPSDAYMNAYLTSYDQAYVEGYQRHADRIANVAGGGEREQRRRRHRRSEPEAPTRAREVYAQSQQAPSTSAHSTETSIRTPTATSMTLSSSSGSTETAHPALRRSGTTGHDSLAASSSRRALTAAERDARRRAAFSQTDEERQRRERREQRESITSSFTSSAPSWTGTQVSVPESQASVGQFRLANFPTSPPEPTGEVPAVSPHIPPALLFVPPTAASPGSPPLELLNSPTGSPADLAVPGAPRQGPRALSVSTGASSTPRVWSAQSYGSRGSRGSGLSNLLGLTEMETVSSAAPLSMPTPRQPAPAFLRALSETYSG